MFHPKQPLGAAPKQLLEHPLRDPWNIPKHTSVKHSGAMLGECSGGFTLGVLQWGCSGVALAGAPGMVLPGWCSGGGAPGVVLWGWCTRGPP